MNPTRWIAGITLTASFTLIAGAQESAPANAVNTKIQDEMMFTFVSPMGGVGGATVKNAPYTAVQVTEIVQTLADGSHITRKNTGAIARDSEGRTRQEMNISALGPWSSNGEAHTFVNINDPVAGVHYALETQNHIARKVTVPSSVQMAQLKNEVNGQIKIMIGTSKQGEASTGKTESLGKQSMEGVMVEGTRSTTTIPAGEIGNDRAIDIVFEKWYSPELQTIVMSKRTDPRSGENTFRLTNISRAEPSSTLFEVPANYSVQDSPEPGMFRAPLPPVAK